MSDSNNHTLDPTGRFIRTTQVISSFHDYVCYLGLEKDSLVQVFWYEFMNENLTEEDQSSALVLLENAMNISSPYIMNILSVWKSSSPPRFYVVTEALQAPFLSDYIRSLESLPNPKAVIKWFKSLALAVQALHTSAHKIIHGSISTNAVFFKTASGILKLRMPLTTLSKRAISRHILDFDVYKAPERIRGMISETNDIWSLGIVLLELLTNRPAYEECRTPIDLIEKITSYKLPESLSTITNKAAADLIRECLQPELFRIKIEGILQNDIFQE